MAVASRRKTGSIWTGKAGIDIAPSDTRRANRPRAMNDGSATACAERRSSRGIRQQLIHQIGANDLDFIVETDLSGLFDECDSVSALLNGYIGLGLIVLPDQLDRPAEHFAASVLYRDLDVAPHALTDDSIGAAKR